MPPAIALFSEDTIYRLGPYDSDMTVCSPISLYKMRSRDPSVLVLDAPASYRPGNHFKFMLSCGTGSDVLQNATKAALVCAASDDIFTPCDAICPNPDISGIGVRGAFYIQSALNTFVALVSRRDSVTSTWAGTLLTGALVIAAMIQKGTQAITLHHATLTMNFATLSCISSLAVAPTLSIWRLTPEEYSRKRLARDLLEDSEDEDRHGLLNDAAEMVHEKKTKRIKRAQNRQRLFLALALLTQVILQWAWGVVLFVSPVYSQPNCSGGTILIFFFKDFAAREVNRRYMVVWVLWLLFSLGITLGMTIVLAITSPTLAEKGTPRSRRSSRSSTPHSFGTRTSGTLSSTDTRPYALFWTVVESVPSWKERVRQRMFWYSILCVLLWSIYITSSELQIKANCVFEGENSITGFGQITALLLSLAPLWNLIIAVYKWLRRQRKLKRRREREQARQAQSSNSNHDTSNSAHEQSMLSSDVIDISVSTEVALAVSRGQVVDSIVLAAPGLDRATPILSNNTARAQGRGRSRRPRTSERSRSRSTVRSYAAAVSAHENTRIPPPTLAGILLTSPAEWDEFKALGVEARASLAGQGHWD